MVCFESAINRYPEVLQAANAVVDRPRDSFPLDQDVELFRAKLERYRDANEDTLLNQILPFFIKETRWVPTCRSRASEFPVLQRVLIEQSAENSINNESVADPEKLARVADLTESEEQLGMLEKAGPDLNTFIFSVVLTDQIFEVWIHWAEVHDPDPKHPEKPL
ncbi:MAG: hypothetical protein L6R37_008240 [Teloschistes peruensis]|nr:MAG: hypothetical protein L6R37_008240 [Teloschistes peruensis]